MKTELKKKKINKYRKLEDKKKKRMGQGSQLSIDMCVYTVQYTTIQYIQ
jgi:hypothetical protein